MFQKISTGFTDLYVLQPFAFEDARGAFVKTFHSPIFRDLGIGFAPQEEFYSTSKRNVLRGMHFQSPPHAHTKLVYCLEGRVLDVVLDIRTQSVTFGKSFALELGPDNRNLLFIPPGFAHGFLGLTENCIMVYKTDVPHFPASDSGIAWDSFGFTWPVKCPTLSERDQRFVRWDDFRSPF